MAYVGRAYAVVQQVEQRAIEAIHRLHRAFGPGPLGGGIDGNGHIGVLKPGPVTLTPEIGPG